MTIIAEVKLEELIEKHRADLSKEHEERIKAMKDEVAYFYKVNPPQTQQGAGGGGGIFGDLIGQLTKKMPASIQAGMTAGLAAGGVMALVEILSDALSNSKILTTVLGTIGKALGLLIDVILLPFLPALLVGIIWLYRGIMSFSKIWSGFWNSPVGKGLAAFVAFFATGGIWRVTIEFLVAAWAAIFKWIYELSTSGASAIVNIAFGIVGAFFGFLDWLFKLVNIDMGKISLEVILTNAGGWFVDFLDWIRKGVATIVVTLTNPAEAAKTAATNLANTVTNNPMKALGWMGNPVGMLIDLLQPGHAAGGNVLSSGIALVHKGETITPAGSGGNITFNFPNYVGSKSDLQKMISDVLRQQQYRYNV